MLLVGLRPPVWPDFSYEWIKLQEYPFDIYTAALALSLSQKIMHVELLIQIFFYKEVVWYVFQADETQNQLPVASWFLELHFNCVSSCLLNLRYVFFIFKQHFVVLFHCRQLICSVKKKKIRLSCIAMFLILCWCVIKYSLSHRTKRLVSLLFPSLVLGSTDESILS